MPDVVGAESGVEHPHKRGHGPSLIGTGLTLVLLPHWRGERTFAPASATTQFAPEQTLTSRLGYVRLEGTGGTQWQAPPLDSAQLLTTYLALVWDAEIRGVGARSVPTETVTKYVART